MLGVAPEAIQFPDGECSAHQRAVAGGAATEFVHPSRFCTCCSRGDAVSACSAFIKPVFTLAWTRPAATPARWWARLRGVPPLPLSWVNTCGPLFGNTIATLLVDGRSAEVLFEQPRGPDALDEVGRVPLSRPS